MHEKKYTKTIQFIWIKINTAKRRIKKSVPVKYIATVSTLLYISLYISLHSTIILLYEGQKDLAGRSMEKEGSVCVCVCVCISSLIF